MGGGEGAIFKASSGCFDGSGCGLAFRVIGYSVRFVGRGRWLVAS